MTREPSLRRVVLISLPLCLQLMLLLTPFTSFALYSVNGTGTCGTYTVAQSDPSASVERFEGDVIVTFTTSGDCAVKDLTLDGQSYPYANPLKFYTAPWLSSNLSFNFSAVSEFTVSATATGSEAGTATITRIPSSGRTGPGGSVEFRISPAPGSTVDYSGLNVVGKGEGSLSQAPDGGFVYTVSNVRGDVTVTIPVVKARTIKVEAEHATIGKDGVSIPSGGSVVVPDGDRPVFTITPDPGYACVKVVTPSGEKPCNGAHKYTLQPVTNEFNDVIMTTARGYVIAATSGGNGTIFPAGEVPVTAGSSQSFTFTPDTGYVVDTVTVDRILQPAERSYLFSDIQSNHDIEVIFRPAGASMRSYCNAPPFVPSGMKSNLLLLIDNSSSMYDLAYTGASFCVDDGYDNTRSYPGYFQEGLFYSYDTAAARFASRATLPATCNAASTGYLCLQMTEGTPPRTVVTFAASGRFLNWLTTSKIDLEKKVLTGGNFHFDNVTGTSGYLEGESRGCQGKRFVKIAAEAADITFAVHGPLPSDADYTYRASLGGPTRIDIYDKGYLKAQCQKVVDEWLGEASRDEMQTAVTACLGNPTDTSGLTTQSQLYNIAMVDCYTYLKTRNPADLHDGNLYGMCDERQSASIADDEGVCTDKARHVWHASGFATTGFLGTCLRQGGGGASQSTGCTKGQMMDFCLEIKKSTVTDPAATASSKENSANIPSFVLDAGISGLGRSAGTFLARAGVSSPPTGQIQAFSSKLNIGAMIFNQDGAGSECVPGRVPDAGEAIPCLSFCVPSAYSSSSNIDDFDGRSECYDESDCKSGERCFPAPKMDGGRIISYINHSPVGDHAGGLIHKLDRISGNSWTPFAEAFYTAIGYFANRTDLRLQQGDFDEAFPPSRSSCQKNNILIISDGMSTTDSNERVNALAALYAAEYGGSTGSDSQNSCPGFKGSRSLDDLARLASTRDITTFSTSTPSAAGTSPSHSITTHAIYLGHPPLGSPVGDCDPVTLLRNAAEGSGGHFSNAPDPAGMERTFNTMLQLISGGGNSGSDPSLLSTGGGSGALFMQPLFYTQKGFDTGTTPANWLGELQTLWYHIDPLLGDSDGSGSTVREETGYSGTGDHFLDLKTDRVVEFTFNSGKNLSEATLYLDQDGDGKADPVQPRDYPQTKVPEEVQSLWRAGMGLWRKDPEQRVVYTHTNDRTLTDFSRIDLSSNLSLLQAADRDEAAAIVDFVLGRAPAAGTRDRQVKIGGTASVWKLGDIISSTPRVQSHVPLNSYHLPPPRGYQDTSYRSFISSSSYAKRGTVYVGANDGMLHAFRVGRLRDAPAEADLSAGTPSEDPWPVTRKAALSGSGLGEEVWGFVPKNALPYLKYLKEPLYTHLYYVDGGITLADASIGRPAGCSGGDYWDCFKDSGSNWRTVLIGGMGQGGASRGAGDACSDTVTGTCVKAPLPATGLSSYFALDVTGQRADGSGTPPTLLWEFAPAGLGYATSGAAVVKISARTEGKADDEKNGRWFAVFASGPTGPIDGSTCQFKGKSDQRLKIFVVDLAATPPLALGTNYWEIDTPVDKGFGGSISGGGIDVDKWNPANPGHYQDDAVYVGYTREGDAGSWNRGGVLRLSTGEDPDPSRWRVSTVIDGIGPVTGGIAKLQDRTRHKLWLFFGTGRYFYNQDDMSGLSALYGVQEPCYRSDPLVADTFDPACTASRTEGDLSKKTTDPSDTLYLTGDKGWYIELDRQKVPDAGFGSERSLATPTASTAGAVFFTTFKPSADPCYMGGNSYTWGVKYDSGGALAGTAAAFSGKAVTLLSTGSLSSLSLKGGFSEQGGRRSAPLAGKPGGVKIISNSGLKPVRKILHMQER